MLSMRVNIYHMKNVRVGVYVMCIHQFVNCPHHSLATTAYVTSSREGPGSSYHATSPVVLLASHPLLVWRFTGPEKGKRKMGAHKRSLLWDFMVGSPFAVPFFRASEPRLTRAPHLPTVYFFLFR